MVMTYLIKLLTALFVFASFPLQAAEKVIRLAYGEYPPYSGKSLNNNGPISEIIVQAYQRVGYQVELHYIPSWARRIKMIENGDFDGTYSAWYREGRERWFVFTDPLPANEIVFYKRKKALINYKTLNDLKGLQIGVVTGYVNSPRIKAAQLQTQRVEKESQNIGKLLLKRIDLALIDKEVGQYLLSTQYKNHRHKVEWLEPAVETINQHLIISKKAVDFQTKADAFNSGLKSLEAEGKVNKIMQQHGLYKDKVQIPAHDQRGSVYPVQLNHLNFHHL